MHKFLLVAILVLSIFALPAQAEQKPDELPFHLPTPEGWKTETIPFPLGFAPELDYEGFEELRFAPGMFKPEEEDFWSYTFVWWVPAATEISAAILQRDLDAYYGGLNHGVNDKEENQPEIPAVRSTVRAVDVAEDAPLEYAGTIDTFDSFVTQKPISLNFRAEVITCADQGHIAVYFELSPQATTHGVWENLHRIREGFRCEE
jgi:hypothetical protein